MNTKIDWIQLKHAEDSKYAICLIQGLEMSLYDSMEYHTLISIFVKEFPLCDIFGLTYPSKISNNGDFTRILDKSDLYKSFAINLTEMICKGYEKIVFLGFCLGGFYLSKSLYFIDPPSVNFSKCSLLLIDTPFDEPKPYPSPWLKRIMDILGIKVSDLFENAQFWRNNNVSLFHTIFEDRIHALVSMKESWISNLKPDHRLNSKRVLKIDIHHNDLFDRLKKGNKQTSGLLTQWIKAHL